MLGDSLADSADLQSPDPLAPTTGRAGKSCNKRHESSSVARESACEKNDTGHCPGDDHFLQLWFTLYQQNTVFSRISFAARGVELRSVSRSL